MKLALLILAIWILILSPLLGIAIGKFIKAGRGTEQAGRGPGAG